MTIAYEEIMKILAGVESENNVPAGTLKRIYDIEKSKVYLRSRTNIHAQLQTIVSETAKKADSTPGTSGE